MQQIETALMRIKRAIKVTVDLLDSYEQQYRNVANANKDTNNVVTQKDKTLLSQFKKKLIKLEIGCVPFLLALP